jgi:hypothetical protein
MPDGHGASGSRWLATIITHTMSAPASGSVIDIRWDTENGSHRRQSPDNSLHPRTTRAGQRGRSGWRQNFPGNPSDKRPFQRQSPSQQSRLGSCSRDPTKINGTRKTYLVINFYARSSSSTFRRVFLPSIVLHHGAYPVAGINLGVAGSWGCNPRGDPDGPGDIKIINRTCTAICTQEHENQHETDLGPCCRKFRRVFQETEPFSDEGFEVLEKWRNYELEVLAWAECRAYRVSFECLKDLGDSNGCDCVGSSTECCSQFDRDLKFNALAVVLTCLGAESQGYSPEGAGPQCPF